MERFLKSAAGHGHLEAQFLLGRRSATHHGLAVEGQYLMGS
jgi:hypothetical protein